MTRLTLRLLLFTTTLSAAALVAWAWQRRSDDTSVSAQPPPSIERVKEIGLLSVLAVDVADVRETAVRGNTGSVQLVLILRGAALLSVDVAQAKLMSADQATRRAVISVSAPKIASVRVDAERSKVYRIDRSGLWLIRPSDELTARLVNKGA